MENEIIDVKKEIAEIKRQNFLLILPLIIIVLGFFLIQSNQSIVCDKISDTCTSKILWFNTGSIPLSDVQSADFSADAKYRASGGFQTYNTKLVTKYSQTIDFYFLNSMSEFKAQDDSVAFNKFLNSNETHFEAKSGLASLAFWQFF